MNERTSLSSVMKAVDLAAQNESRKYGVSAGQTSPPEVLKAEPITVSRIGAELSNLVANLRELTDQSLQTRVILGGKNHQEETIPTRINPEGDGALVELQRLINEAHGLCSEAYSHARATANLL